MPSLIFNADEIEDKGFGTVNKSGYLYVGRRWKDKKIRWIRLNYDK